MPLTQSRIYRVTQLLRTDGVHCQESAGTGPVGLKVVSNRCCLGRLLLLLLLLFFLTFSVLFANPKKLYYKGGQSCSWSAEQEKKKKKTKSGSPPLLPRCSCGENEIKSRDAFTCLGATQASVRRASVQGFLRLVS